MASNEREIWDLLMEGIGNPYGVAGVMGNLRAESSLSPLSMTGTKAKQWDTRRAYADAVNNGSYDRYSFAHDSIAFGLAQWLFWSRKQALYDFAKGQDIGSLDVQIGYLLEEIPKYKEVWKVICSTEDVNEASDIVMEKYERPGTMTDAAKQKRRDFSIAYFDKYASSSPAPDPKHAVSGKKVVTTISNVLVRDGNGKEYPVVGKILSKGAEYPWIATSENNWHAMKMHEHVVWISGDYTKVI